MTDAFNWDEDDADFNPASSRDDVIYMGRRKYVAEDQTAARIHQLEAEVVRLREAVGSADKFFAAFKDRLGGRDSMSYIEKDLLDAYDTAALAQGGQP